jgi:hypothetical protein
VCYLLFGRTDELGEMRGEWAVYMLPRARVRVREMTGDGALISGNEMVPYLVDQTSSSSMICCRAFLFSSPSELPQK